jgi:hypothetical protein
VARPAMRQPSQCRTRGIARRSIHNQGPSLEDLPVFAPQGLQGRCGHGLGTWTVSGTVLRSAGFLCLSHRHGLLIWNSAEARVPPLIGAGFLAPDIQGLVLGRSLSSSRQPSRVITRLFSGPYIHCARRPRWGRRRAAARVRWCRAQPTTTAGASR